MADSSLQAIKNKVRLITRSLSENLLSDAQLTNYINTGILYNFSSELRLFSLRTTFTFYTQPGVDVYKTNTTDPLDPLYNFQNKYITVHPTPYIAGYPAMFTQSRDMFYSNYPQTNFVAQTGLTGNGTTGPFSGTLTQVPIVQNSLVLSCVDTNGTSMVIIDYPDNNLIGTLSTPNQPFPPSNYGSINYQTGQFTVTFTGNTNPGATIWAESLFYQPGTPLTVLYYDNQFTLRPIPDKTYPVQLEADIRPTELLNNGSSPQLEQWWLYISYLAAKLIFEDRMDYDSIAMIMPSLREQENFVNRTNLVQQANQRAPTIYTQGRIYGWGWGWGGNANWPF